MKVFQLKYFPENIFNLLFNFEIKLPIVQYVYQTYPDQISRKQYFTA